MSESCGRCGITVEDKPVTWSLEIGPRGAVWICEACTRDNIRSIEGKLDDSWW